MNMGEIELAQDDRGRFYGFVWSPNNSSHGRNQCKQLAKGPDGETRQEAEARAWRDMAHSLRSLASKYEHRAKMLTDSEYAAARYQAVADMLRGEERRGLVAPGSSRDFLAGMPIDEIYLRG